MSEHRRTRAAFTLLLTAAVLVCSGCYTRIHPYVAPYIKDHSSDPDAILMYDLLLFFDSHELDDHVVVMHGLGYDDPLPKYGRIENRRAFRKLCDRALRDVLGDAYINTGTRLLPRVQTDAEAWVYCGGKTYVAIRQEDGQVLACIDLRVHENVRRYSASDIWELKADIDVLKLSREDLARLNRITKQPENYHGAVADAEKAFEIAVDYASHFGPANGARSEALGWYAVYYSRAADAWVVRNRAYTLVIDPETGEYISDW